MKRILILGLALILIFQLIPVDTALAEELTEDTSIEDNSIEDNSEESVEDDTLESTTTTGEDSSGAAAEESSPVTIESPSALLMEASTGQVIYEKNANEKRSPASITKIMTLILIYDAIASGQITLTDEATTSAYAKSMGGSQVYLEEGEKQTVETLIKCIVIASGNDAAVTMAEFVSGSEQEFINKMNERAAQLNMTNTHFEDCCGLTESTNHYTTAMDIAIMSRELITKYPEVQQYTTIWMENITHVTKQGSSEFGLTNTNKLLRTYDGITGLKTGSTSLAKYCVSATAKRNGIELISVIMAAPDYKIRFSDAATLLTYGFGVCNLYTDENTDVLPNVVISHGVEEEAGCAYANGFNYLDTQGNTIEGITKEIRMNDVAEAPIMENDVAGKAVYLLDGTEIGSVDILYTTSVEKAGFTDYLLKALKQLMI